VIGHLYRLGTLSTRATVDTLDHDVPSLAEGVMIPHGIDDLQRQQGDVNLGASHDTRALACDNVRQ
jgi:Rhodopirellula transposase DDE domain